MSNPNYKPSEGKREEFRKYLEKAGVMDALTKVLVALYEDADKPDNAVEFICNHLAIQVCGESLDSIRGQLMDAQAKIVELETENAALKDEGKEEVAENAEPPEPSEVPAAAAAPAE